MRLRRRAAPDHGDLEQRIVWLLGSPRSGTTWLLNLLARRPEVAKIDEPGIGVHLGVFLHQAIGAPARTLPARQSMVSQMRAQSADYFFNDEYAAVWRPALRELMLGRFAAQLERDATPGALCVVKEPNGAQAADLLFGTLPAARMLWLLRDGRDVVDSELDAVASGAWGAFDSWDMNADDRLRFIEERSYVWLRRAEILEDVYARLPDAQRLRLRYEDARADTPAALAAAVAWLGLDVRTEELEQDAAALSFERVPTADRGAGKFVRSASPGAWRENLTAAEHDVMDRVMGAKLVALGYAPSNSR